MNSKSSVDLTNNKTENLPKSGQTLESTSTSDYSRSDYSANGGLFGEADEPTATHEYSRSDYSANGGLFGEADYSSSAGLSPLRGPKRVFVSGCYDMLHSGHVAFFRSAAQFGDLYVGIGSDETIRAYKNRKTIYSERERLYMVKAIRYVKDAFINDGSGIMDFVGTMDRVKPDIFVVNSDGGSEEKRRLCEERGIEYIELERIPDEGLEARSTTSLRKTECRIPTRLDLAGTWIDQPYVSKYHPGWALTISLEPTFEIKERCGLSTSTRNMIRKIWPYQLPAMDPEMLAKLSFCFENEPARQSHVSGAQDAIGICMPGLVRHYYDGTFWPSKIESCYNNKILDWLEDHLCMVMMFPRPDNTDVVGGSNITESGVLALTNAAEKCWDAIMDMDLDRFAEAYRESFDAQIAMFPAMKPKAVDEFINKYKNEVMAYKMPGAGGGGYLAFVVKDRDAFITKHPEAIRLSIRRHDTF